MNTLDSIAGLFGYVPRFNLDRLRQSLDASLADAEMRAIRSDDMASAKDAVIDSLYSTILPGKPIPTQLNVVVSDIEDYLRAARLEVTALRWRANDVSHMASDIAEIKKHVLLIVY